MEFVILFWLVFFGIIKYNRMRLWNKGHVDFGTGGGKY